MKGKTVKTTTAAMIGAGLLTLGLLAGSAGTVLLPRADDRIGAASASDASRRPARSATPSPATTKPPEPAPTLPVSERRDETVDFATHSITCSGDVYWDWQVGNRARGGSGSCRDWAVAMELDEDGPTLEQQELLGLLPEQQDTRSSGEVQWDYLVEQGVIDDAGNYLDEDGYPTGQTTYDDEGCDPETTDCD